MKTEKIDIIYRALFYHLNQIIGITDSQYWLENHIKESIVFEYLTDYQKQLQEPPLSNTILSIASKIASGTKKFDKPLSEDCYKLQSDIFNVFGEEKSDRYYAIEVLKDNTELNIATDKVSTISKECYRFLLESLVNELKTSSFDERSLPSVLSIFEAIFSYVPLISDEQLSDISLAEHSHLTAGFATAILDYLKSQGQVDNTTEFLTNEQLFYQEKVFLLASFDLSGIQNFIYNIATSGAAKQLKARSLYLDFMCEHIVDSLLEELELSRANLLYIGGGHAYFILPNTVQTVLIVEKFEETFNQFLLENFQTDLYVALGWSEFSASEIMNHQNNPENSFGTYQEIYHRVSQMISDKKLSRYDAKTLIKLNNQKRAVERECEICHSTLKIEKVTYRNEDEQDKDNQFLCHLCNELRKFAREIKEATYFKIVAESSKGLPIGMNRSLIAIEKDNKDFSKENGRLYVKNKWTNQYDANHIFIGDYQTNEIYEYAELSRKKVAEKATLKQGIKRLAVLRLDVDDLGAAFMGGFAKQHKGTYNSLARSAMFSKQMSRFFKFHLNQLAKNKKLTIIYSGGDDVFAIGVWQDIIQFTIEIRQQFINFTNGKLTLSAGIGLYPDKTPISLMALDAGDLEEAAKDNQSGEGNSKDSISLFNKKYTFQFDDFIENIYQRKLKSIRSYFSKQDERGISFLYRLVELLQSDDEMNLPRLAYLLARLEDSSSDKEKFQIFKNEFWSWYKAGAKERKKVEFALIYYLYEIRKEK